MPVRHDSTKKRNARRSDPVGPAPDASSLSSVFPSLRARLLRWFEANRRDLPWRAPFDPSTHGASRRSGSRGAGGLLSETPPLRPPYAVWISEIMLQQTQVATVAPRFADWMRRFPDVTALAEAPEAEVLRAWAGLGYYARARNLHRGAKALRDRGVWPRDAREWREIPGVGDYTAGAVASIAFDRPEPILDGNVVRVFSRLLGLEFLPGDGAAQKRAYWELARAWADAPRPGALNEALMELGALVCAPASPRCDACPLRDACVARAEGRQGSLPPARRRAPVETVAAVAVVATARGRVLLEERPRGAFLAGHALFPLFLGEEARAWKSAFRKRHPGVTTLSEAGAGAFRHAIMSKRYEVEVWTLEARVAKHESKGAGGSEAFWSPVDGLDEGLTNSLAKKIWTRAAAARR
jgi:A/G-specific adenine glycosylase